MKKKLELTVLVIILICTGVFAAWKTGWIARGVETAFIAGAEKALGAKILLGSVDLYGNFLILRGLDVSHRDYRVKIKEIVVEYSLKEMFSNRMKPLSALRKVTLQSPSFWFREMEWEEIKPQVFPSWTGFFKAAPDMRGIQVNLVNGRVELGKNVISSINFNLGFDRQTGDFVPLHIYLKAMLRSGDIKVPLKFNSSVKFGSDRAKVSGRLQIGAAVPYVGSAKIDGVIYDPKSPRMEMDVRFVSRSIRFEGFQADSAVFTARIEGDAGSPGIKGKFSAKSLNIRGVQAEGVGLEFTDDSESMRVSLAAKLQQGRIEMERGVLKKTGVPVFEGGLLFSSPGYNFRTGIFYSREALEFSGILLEIKGETVLSGTGKGRLTQKKLESKFNFAEGKYPQILLDIDFPFAESLGKKISVIYGKEAKADIELKAEKAGIPFSAKLALTDLAAGGYKISGDLGLSGRLQFAGSFALDAGINIGSLSAVQANTPSAGGMKFRLKDTVISARYRNDSLVITPEFINGRDAEGEILISNNKCVMNVTYFSEPIMRLTGEICASADTVVISKLRLNNTQVDGSLGLKSKTINIAVSMNEENPLLFASIAGIFSSAAEGFKTEENAIVSGSIEIAGTFEHPAVSGTIEYKGQAVDMLKITDLRLDGETLSFRIEAKKGDSTFTVNEGLVLISKQDITIMVKGGLRVQAGQGENPAFLVAAPFYLNGRITGLDKSPRFTCDAGIYDAMINKKLGRSVKTSLSYSEGKLEFIPAVSKNDYYLSGGISFGEKKVEIRQLALCLGNTKPLLVSGIISLSDQVMDLNIRYVEKMSNLAIFFPGDLTNASGQIDVDLNIAGDMGDPAYSGSAKFYNGELAFVGVKDPVSDIRAVVDFETGLMKLDSSVFTGGTTLFFNGDIEYSKWVPVKLSIHVKNDYRIPMRVSLPNFAAGEIAILLDIEGSADSALAKGKVNIMNMAFTDIPGAKQGGGGLDFLSFLKWDVEMVFKSNNRYYNDFVEVEIARDSGFVFRWDGTSIFAKGRGEAERGRFTYMNAEFQVVKGSSYEAATVNEDGVSVIKGYLDAKGTARVGGKKLTLEFKGEMGKIEPVLTSEPPVSRAEMLALLNPDFYQSDQGAITEDQFRELLKKEALGMLTGGIEAQYITKPISSAVRRALRVDVFRIKSEMLKNIAMATSSESGSITLLTPFEGSSVEIGKYIVNNLYVDYKAILEKGGVLTSEWGVEYTIIGNVKTRFNYRPKDDPLKTEYELFLEASFRL